MSLIIGLVIMISAILILRLLGAWMFRINEIIRNQKILIDELKKLHGQA